MLPYLLTGYQPERVRRTQQLVSEIAREVDIQHFGPALTVQDISRVRQFCEVAPADGNSQGRVAVLDLDRTRVRVQHSLLRLIEEPAPATAFVLTVTELDTVLPTIQSRCCIEVKQAPSYGAIIKDLATQGMALSSAAFAATRVSEGLSVEVAPDEQAQGKAKAFLAVCGERRYSQILKLVGSFDDRALTALRLQLLATRQLGALVRSYGGQDPSGAATLIALELVEATRRN